MEENPPIEFENEAVKVKVHSKPLCKIELEVDASPSLVKEAHDKAIKIVSKEVTVAGFRKGKASGDLVAKNYPKQVDEQWQKTIADVAFREARKLINTPILNNELKIGFNLKSHSLTEGAKVILFFETEPTVPEIDPKEITLEAVERPIVNEDKVNETIRQLQLFFAEWKTIEDRGAKEGDFLILDVDVIEEDPPRKLFSNVRFEVTDRSMAKWMKDLVLGHHKNEILEGVSVPDADASKADQEELQPKKVRVVIKQIETATLPELTDDFAKKIGTASIEEMKTNVEKLLNKKADSHVQEKLREATSEILLTKYPFDVPHSLIDREVRFRLQQLVQDPEYVKHWNSMTAEAKKRVVTSISEQSEKAVRMFYLCRKILATAKINVTPKDLPHMSDTPLDMLLGERREINPQENTEVHQAEAFSRLLLEKAEDYIIANATMAPLAQ